MSLFPDTIARALAGGIVQCASLFRFDFTSEPVRVWTGGFNVDTNDGERWQNVGSLGSVSGIEQAINGEAPEANFTLSGIDPEILQRARDEFPTEAKGNLARAYMQFFGIDDPNDPDNQRPLDLPYPIWAGRMLKPTYVIGAQDAQGGAECSLSVSAESIFSLRSRPRWGMNTDSDQQHRFPGDKGFEFVGSLVNKVVTWPDY